MKMKSAIFALAATLYATGAMAAGNVYETLKSDPQFSTLVAIIDANGSKHNYTSGTRTVFAPTNTAFESVKGGYQDMISGQARTNTQALLLYQIVPGVHTPESFKGKTVTLNTLQKDPVTIYGTGEKLHFGDAYGADQSGEALTASNGVIIPVDNVPVPVFDTADDGVPVPAPVMTRTPLN